MPTAFQEHFAPLVQESVDPLWKVDEQALRRADKHANTQIRENKKINNIQSLHATLTAGGVCPSPTCFSEPTSPLAHLQLAIVRAEDARVYSGVVQLVLSLIF